LTKLATPKYNLARVNPNVAQSWHSIKNGNLKPQDITPGSSKTVWWICEIDPSHEWQAKVYTRNKGHGCPYCDGKKISKSNNLTAKNPNLAKEWHPTKNSTTPDQVTSGSHNKAWWKCKKQPGHEWEAVIKSRSFGRGCPYCTNRKVHNSNSLATINPGLAREWHPTKNKSISAHRTVAGSKRKAWWRCSRGHEWCATIDSRNRGAGCPKCHSATSQLEIRLYTEFCLYLETFYSGPKYMS
jgi:Zn finger protein HypA/HybF involved in hydrogenase expression